MKKIKIIAILFFILNFYSFSSGEESSTNNKFVGRDWKALNTYNKICYVLGFREGIQYCSELEPNFEGIDKEIVKSVLQNVRVFDVKATNGEVAAYIDKFYTDVANLNIPVIKVYLVMFVEYSGTNDFSSNSEKLREKIKSIKSNKEAVQFLIEDLRAQYNQ